MFAEFSGAQDEPQRWERMRAEVPAAERWAYFDHAAVAPLPAPTRDAVAAWLAAAASDGSAAWSGWADGVERLRQRAAGLLGADPSEIALVPNTTTGISYVAEGWPWQSGENVVTLENEFPSNAYPWLNLAARGVETRRVPAPGGQVDYDTLAAACDTKTRLMAVSWIGYASGLRLDLSRLAELAHRRGVLLLVDAIQGLGVFPLDVSRVPIDFLAADGHKWMMGPEGAGLLYIRQSRLERLRPLNVGWHSVEHTYDYARIEMRLRPTAARYEGGSQNMAGMLGLDASLEWLMRYGLSPGSSAIADRLLDQSVHIAQRLERLGATITSPRELDARSGILSFQLPGLNPKTVRQRCLEAGVILSCREGRVRLSPHAYVNDEDIARLEEALKRCLKSEE